MKSKKPIIQTKFESHKSKIAESINRHPSFKEKLQSSLGNNSGSYDLTVMHSSHILNSDNETRTRMFTLLKEYGTLRIINNKSEAPEPMLFSMEDQGCAAYLFRALNDTALRVLCKRLKDIQTRLRPQKTDSKFEVSLQKAVNESIPQGLLTLSFDFYGRSPFIRIKTFGAMTEKDFRELVRLIKKKQIEGSLEKWKPALKGENLRKALDERYEQLKERLMSAREKTPSRQTAIEINGILADEFGISIQRVKNYLSQPAS